MLKRIVPGLLLLPVLLMTASFAHAQPSNLGFSGRIVVPIPGYDEYIEVLLMRSESENDSETFKYTFTNSHGDYSFSGLTAGNYFVVVNVDGFEKTRERVILFPHDSVSESVARLVQPWVPIILTRAKADKSASSSTEPSVVDVSVLNRKYPKKAVEEYSKALDANKKGDTAKAVERLEAALKLAPDFYDAHLNVGLLYQKMGRIRDAEREYRKAHDLNAQAASPLTNLGRLYLDEADSRSKDGPETVQAILVQARDALEAATKLDPRSAMAYLLLGSANYRSTVYDKAEEQLKLALALDKAMGLARLMLANLYVRQQKWESALNHLDVYLAENPAVANRAEIEATRLSVARQLEGTSSSSSSRSQ